MADGVLAIDSPVGRLRLTEQGGALTEVAWADAAARAPTALLDEAARQIAAYFDGQLTAFDLPLAPAGTGFRQSVWGQMCEIPYGETRTYNDLAKALKTSPRPVGGACGANPIPIVIPCHRVTASAGPGGYSGGNGLETKHYLLDLEARVAGRRLV